MLPLVCVMAGCVFRFVGLARGSQGAECALYRVADRGALFSVGAGLSSGVMTSASSLKQRKDPYFFVEILRCADPLHLASSHDSIDVHDTLISICYCSSTCLVDSINFAGLHSFGAYVFC